MLRKDTLLRILILIIYACNMILPEGFYRKKKLSIFTLEEMFLFQVKVHFLLSQYRYVEMCELKTSPVGGNCVS